MPFFKIDPRNVTELWVKIRSHKKALYKKGNSCLTKRVPKRTSKQHVRGYLMTEFCRIPVFWKTKFGQINKVSNELYRSGETGKPKIPDIKAVTASKLSVKYKKKFCHILCFHNMKKTKIFTHTKRNSMISSTKFKVGCYWANSTLTD